MTDRPIDVEALTAALAERAREDAGVSGPDPEELLDYLAGRLDAEAARRVERRLVADPEAARALLDLAELEAAGRQAAAGDDRAGAGGQGTAPPADLAVRAGWRDFRGRLAAGEPARRRGPALPWLAAAALAAVGVGLGYRVWDLERELARPAAVAATLELHSGVRSGAEPEAVELAPGERLLVVLAPAVRCDRYEAAIVGPGGAGPETVPGLVRDDQGSVMLQLGPAPGAYTLTLSGCEPRRELETHRFRVARPPPSGGGDGG